ncbi:protein jagged-1-like, partial [Osmerus eperlanus]|uniref:protein jagged-1-like n=1 Tax=Osmerus eperlanus TaxID=29151 RepID=UPI002E121946
INSCHGQCQNGATCKDGRSGYVCVCPPGYAGRHCEVQRNGCASDPCQNSAKCHVLPDGFMCECPSGFSGTTCEVQTAPCSPNPCQNKAQCHSLMGDFYCACPDDYEGKTCSELKDHCQTNPDRQLYRCRGHQRHQEGVWHISSNVCGPHGRCISQPAGNFTCSCDPGFTGLYCHENINDCVASPCKNGGTCIDGISSFQCFCPDGWEGPLCDLDVNDCVRNTCKNGGRCVDLLNDFYCSAPTTGRARPATHVRASVMPAPAVTEARATTTVTCSAVRAPRVGEAAPATSPRTARVTLVLARTGGLAWEAGTRTPASARTAGKEPPVDRMPTTATLTPGKCRNVNVTRKRKVE